MLYSAAFLSQFESPVWIFFHEHSQSTGLHAKEGGHFFSSSRSLQTVSEALRH